MRFTEIYYKAGSEKFYAPSLQAEINPEDVKFTYIGRTSLYRKIKNGKVVMTDEHRFFKNGDKVLVLQDGKNVIRELVWDDNTKEDLKDRDFKYTLVLYGVTTAGIPVKFVLSGMGIGNAFETFSRIKPQDGAVPIVKVTGTRKFRAKLKYKGPVFTLEYENRDLTPKESEVLQYYNEKFPYESSEMTGSGKQLQPGEAAKLLFGQGQVNNNEPNNEEEDEDLPF